MTDVSKPWQGSPPTAFKPKKPFMPRLVRSNKPDHVIGPGATLQGRLEFKGLLRVEGRFEGVLKPVEGANMMVARSGVIAGDVEGCHSVIIEGTVIGNVSASVVVLRRHANVQGNVWCKDLAAAATAVFRNRVTESPAPSSSSSSSHHRRSSSASSGVIGDAGGRPRGGGGGGGATGGKAHTPPASSSGNRTTQPTPSPDSDRQASSTSTAAGTADESDSAPAAAAAGMPDAIAVAVASTFPTAGGGGGAGGSSGGCPFSGRDGEAFAMDASSSTVLAAAETSAASTTNSVVAAAVGSSSSRRCGGGGGGGGSWSSLPNDPHALVVPVAEKSAKVHGNNLLSPQTPPPSTGRRHGGASGDAGCGAGVGAYGRYAAVESPPRTHRRAVHAGSTPGRALSSGFSTAPGGGGEGHPSAGGGGGRSSRLAGFGGGFSAMGQEQGGAGCQALLSGAAAAGPGDRCPGGAANSQTDRWRDCGKDYGVRSSSLTSAFSSVAMLLRFADGETGFDKHLEMEYAAENLWFWKQGMKFRSTQFEGAARRREEARRIFDTFLAVDSPDQVNISHEDREDVLAALENRLGAQAVGAGLFDGALVQVENMLALGPFPRFVSVTVETVKTSWQKVLDRFDFQDMADSFYSVLFEVEPSVESLFTRSKRFHGEMLMRMVDTAVKLLNNLQELVPGLLQLGLRHNAYKVRKEHFPVVGEALIATLGLVLQNEFTDEVKQSWAAVYSLLSNIMISVLDPPPEDDMIEGGLVTPDDSPSNSCSLDSASLMGSEGSVSPPGGAAAVPSEASARAAAVAGGSGGGTSSAAAKPSVGRPKGEEKRGALRSVGSGNGSGASFRGMYRRGTSSFRNQFSKLVRKESILSVPPSASSPTEHPASAAAAATSSPTSTATTTMAGLSTTTSTSTSSDVAAESTAIGAATSATMGAAAAAAAADTAAGGPGTVTMAWAGSDDHNKAGEAYR